MKTMIEEINAELERLCVTPKHLGSCDGIVAQQEDDQIILADDGAIIRGSGSQILTTLKNLPDAAGWEKTWEELSFFD